MWIDTHCHLNLPEFDADVDAVRGRAEEDGVEAAVVVGIDLETSRLALDLAARDPWFVPVVGIHPHDAATVDGEAWAALAEMARTAAAVGETGLDCYRMRSPKEAQREAFRRQAELALHLGKPLVVHCRDAHEETLEVLEGFGREIRGVMHCFSGDAAMAGRCIDLGLHISVAGPVTYPKADRLREVARSVPDDRLLIETDCPFLPPQPVRGKRNEPAYVRFTGEMVAHVRGLDPDRLAAITTGNARALFGIADRKEVG